MAIAINPDVRELDFSDNVKVSKFMQDFSDFRMKKWVTYRPVNAPSPSEPFLGGTRQFIINMGTGHIIDTLYSGLWFTLQFTNLSPRLVWAIATSLPRTSAAWIESVTFQHSNVAAHIDERLADYDAVHSFFTPGKDVRSMKQTFFLNDKSFVDGQPFNVVEDDDTYGKLLPAGYNSTKRISTADFSFFIPLSRLSTIFNSGRYFFPSLLRGNGEMTLAIRSVHNTLSEIFGGEGSAFSLYTGHNTSDYVWSTAEGETVVWTAGMTNMKLVTLNLDNAFLTKEYNAFIASGRKFIRSFKGYNYQYFQVKEGYNRIEIANTHQSISHVVLAFQAAYSVRVNGRPTCSLANQFLGAARVPVGGWAIDLTDENGDPIPEPPMTLYNAIGTQIPTAPQTISSLPPNTGEVRANADSKTILATMTDRAGRSITQSTIAPQPAGFTDRVKAMLGSDAAGFIANSLVMTGDSLGSTTGNLMSIMGKLIHAVRGATYTAEAQTLMNNQAMRDLRLQGEVAGQQEDPATKERIITELAELLNQAGADYHINKFTGKPLRDRIKLAEKLYKAAKFAQRTDNYNVRRFNQVYGSIAEIGELTEAQKILILHMFKIKPDDTTSLKAKVLEFLGTTAANLQNDATKTQVYNTILQKVGELNNSPRSLADMARDGGANAFQDALKLMTRMTELLRGGEGEDELDNPATILDAYRVLDEQVGSWHRHHFHMVPSEAKQSYDLGMHTIDRLQVYRGTGNGETVFSEPINGDMFYHISREALGDAAENHPYFGFDAFKKDGAVITISLNTFMRDAAHEYWDGFSTNRVADRLYVEFNANSLHLNSAAEITPWYASLGYNVTEPKFVCKVFTIYDNIYYIDRNNNLNVADTLIPLQEGRGPVSE